MPYPLPTAGSLSNSTRVPSFRRTGSATAARSCWSCAADTPSRQLRPACCSRCSCCARACSAARACSCRCRSSASRRCRACSASACRCRRHQPFPVRSGHAQRLWRPHAGAAPRPGGPPPPAAVAARLPVVPAHAPVFAPHGPGAWPRAGSPRRCCAGLSRSPCAGRSFCRAPPRSAGSGAVSCGPAVSRSAPRRRTALAPRRRSTRRLQRNRTGRRWS